MYVLGAEASVRSPHLTGAERRLDMLVLAASSTLDTRFEPSVLDSRDILRRGASAVYPALACITSYDAASGVYPAPACMATFDAESGICGALARGVAANTITCSALINACGKSRQWETALAIFEDMKRDGVEAGAFLRTSASTQPDVTFRLL